MVVQAQEFGLGGWGKFGGGNHNYAVLKISAFLVIDQAEKSQILVIFLLQFIINILWGGGV